MPPRTVAAICLFVCLVVPALGGSTLEAVTAQITQAVTGAEPKMPEIPKKYSVAGQLALGDSISHLDWNADLNNGLYRLHWSKFGETPADSGELSVPGKRYRYDNKDHTCSPHDRKQSDDTYDMFSQYRDLDNPYALMECSYTKDLEVHGAAAREFACGYKDSAYDKRTLLHFDAATDQLTEIVMENRSNVYSLGPWKGEPASGVFAVPPACN